MMHLSNSIDDSDWPEVRYINPYAALIGFLRMGVRGLSVLAFTWATVVLLGGFVSNLGNTEFWCLTMITLIHTFSAGVFDFFLTRTSKKSWNSLLGTAFIMVKDIPTSTNKTRVYSRGFKRRKLVFGFTTVLVLLRYFLSAVKSMVLAILMFPIAVVYFAGPCISTGISLWRLVQHDYGDAGTNQKQALVVFYSLSVAQGVFHGYNTLYVRVNGADVVDVVADSYSMDKGLVSDYLHETMIGCAKNPTFCRRRNLVTYAFDLLIESKSRESYLSGVQILGSVLGMGAPLSNFTFGQPDLVKWLLVGSASFGYTMQALIDTMGTGSPHSREIKEHAARIVAHVADAIPLRYFPGGTGFLSFLLKTVEDYTGPCPDSELQDKLLGPTSARPEGDDNWLVVHGLRIIHNLTADEGNLRIILDRTEEFTTKIAAPLISYQLHWDHHGKWSEIAEVSLKIMRRLMAAPGESGKVLRRQISSNISSILLCPKCEVLVIRVAVQILLDLSLDPSNIMDNGSSNTTKLTWILVHIFLIPDGCFDKIWDSFPNRSDDISTLAGEKLLEMLSSNQELWYTLSSNQQPPPIRSLQSEEGSASTMSQIVGLVLGNLVTALEDAGNISNRVHAAEILEHLCRHYTTDNEYLKELKKAMVVAMPKVLREILGYQETEVTVLIEAKNVQGSLQDTVIESGGASPVNAQENVSSSKKTEGRKVKEALLYLCKTIFINWYDEDDPNVTCKLDEIAEKISAEQKRRTKSFYDLLEDILKMMEAEEWLAE